MELERKTVNAIRALLRKAAFMNVTSIRSSHSLSLTGTRGSIRVTVQFTDGKQQPFGFGLNSNIPEARMVAAKANLDVSNQASDGIPFGLAVSKPSASRRQRGGGRKQ